MWKEFSVSFCGIHIVLLVQYHDQRCATTILFGMALGVDPVLLADHAEQPRWFQEYASHLVLFCTFAIHYGS